MSLTSSFYRRFYLETINIDSTPLPMKFPISVHSRVVHLLQPPNQLFQMTMSKLSVLSAAPHSMPAYTAVSKKYK